MVKKLTRHGNSSALIIDRPILDLLKIDEDTPLEITTDGNRLIVEPVKSETRAKRFASAVKEADREYPRMFKRLAE